MGGLSWRAGRVFRSLVFVNIKKSYPKQARKRRPPGFAEQSLAA
jgi:hypothetical protein